MQSEDRYAQLNQARVAICKASPARIAMQKLHKAEAARIADMPYIKHKHYIMHSAGTRAHVH